jgi:3-hydroxyacyl-CoA dehydrogenase
VTGRLDIGGLGVVGAGVMGSEIAFVAARAGMDVVIRDVAEEALARAVAHVGRLADAGVRRGRLTEDEAGAIRGRVTVTADGAGLRGCAVVVEAVPEVIDLKHRVFAELDDLLPDDALLATNTSGLSVTEIAGRTRRPERVVGLHFFNPASVMRLVEVIQGDRTSAGALETAEALARRLGKTPVRVRECPGFLVNRVLVRAMTESYRRAEELGADPADCDAAVVADGPAPMGPFALGDLIGLDTLDHIARDLRTAYGERFADGGVLGRLVGAGRLGRKSGGGFFEGPVEGAGTGPAARDVAERYRLAALDEAVRCLEEGVAALEDVDRAMALGAGWTAGPLAAADARGLGAVRDRLRELAATAGERFAPRQPLTERADSDTTFLPSERTP